MTHPGAVAKGTAISAVVNTRRHHRGPQFRSQPPAREGHRVLEGLPPGPSLPFPAGALPAAWSGGAVPGGRAGHVCSWHWRASPAAPGGFPAGEDGAEALSAPPRGSLRHGENPETRSKCRARPAGPLTGASPAAHAAPPPARSRGRTCALPRARAQRLGSPAFQTPGWEQSLETCKRSYPGA